MSYTFNIFLLFTVLFCACQPKTQYTPKPTEVRSEESAEKESIREQWYESLHRTAPQTNWREIEYSNAKKYYHPDMILERRNPVESFVDGELNGRWIERGSENLAGCVEATWYDPLEDEIYVIGCGGTLFRGPETGNEWEIPNSHVELQSNALQGYQYDGVNYLGAFDKSGVYLYSSDRGQSWTEGIGLPKSTDRWGGSRYLVWDARDSSLWCLNKRRYWEDISLYRSVDGGKSWYIDRTGHSNLFSEVHLHKSINSEDLFYVEDQRVFKRENNAWLLYDNLPIENNAHRFRAGRYEKGLILYTHGDDSLFRKNTSDSIWHFISTLPPNDRLWDVGLGLHPMDSTLLLGGAINCYRSRNQGRSWQEVNQWWEYYQDINIYLHADIMYFNHYWKNDELHLLISNHGGLNRMGSDLTEIENLGLVGLNVGQFYDVATDPTDLRTMYMGSQDQGFQRTQVDPETDFTSFAQQIISGDYGDIIFTSHGTHLWTVYPFGLVHYYENPKTDNFVTASYTLESENEFVWLPAMMPSTDPAENAVYMVGGNPTGGPGSHIIRLEYDHFSQNIEVEKLEYDFLQGVSGGQLSNIAFSPLDKSRWYACTENGSFFYSTDAGESWFQSQILPGGEYLYGAAIEPSKVDDQVVYYGGSGYDGPGVYRSENGGLTFQPMDEGLPPTLVVDLAVSPEDEYLYATTEAGPFVYSFDKSRWYPLIGENTPRTRWWSVEYIDELDIVRFGTYGRGAWDFNIENVVSTVDAPEEEKVVSISPNPSSAFIDIRFAEPSQFSIAGLNGQMVYTQNQEITQQQINVQDWTPGLYFLYAENQRHKIIVQ